MFFQSYPYTYYSLDNTQSIQLVTDITNRAQISNEVKNNLSLYDEYDIKEGETPEIVADKFYNNPELHWVVLTYNDIIDPRFEWPLSTNDLNNYAAGKYVSVNAIHHYEDANLRYTNGNVLLLSSNAFGNFNINDVISNNTNIGTGYITVKHSNSNVCVTVTSGGFITGDQIKLSTNASITGNITSTVLLAGTPVTNLAYEDTVNETKRRVNILKAEYVDAIVQDFKKKLGE